MYPAEHPADRHLTQQQLKFDAIGVTPLHLYYLMAIHQGSFDYKVRAGEYQNSKLFHERVGELLAMGFITYDGRHNITPAGTAYVSKLLAVKPVM